MGHFLRNGSYTICAEGGEVNGKAALTKLNVSGSSDSNYSVVRVNMQNGAALLRLVPQSNG